MKKILVVGGGAAGMAVSLFAARRGAQVHLLEQNEKLGKKLFITGKGRCNFTNAASPEEFLSHVVSNPRFLFSAFHAFTNQDMIDLLESLGVRTKVERGGRAFPLSDHSSDIIRAMEQELKRLGVKISLHTKVRRILIEETEDPSVGKKKIPVSGKACGTELSDGRRLYADAVILATGGLSYPSTGASGDGYAFAQKAGMEVKKPRPALVPLKTKESYIPKLQGLSLKNVRLTIPFGKKKKEVFSEFGEMLFTHEGITGPLVLAASSYIGEALEQRELPAKIDLKPALSEEQLDARVLREFDQAKNKSFKNVIGSLFPSSLRPVIGELAQISPDIPIHEITRAEREHFIRLIKEFPLTIIGAGSFKEAIITQGGISVKEIDPKTMESKRISGLYCIGEVLDLDAVTGGYNLQIAWSSAYACACGICS